MRYIADNRLSKELVEEMYNRIKVPVKQGYGLTEFSSHHSLLISERHPQHIHRNGNIGDPTLDQ